MSTIKVNITTLDGEVLSMFKVTDDWETPQGSETLLDVKDVETEIVYALETVARREGGDAKG